PGGHPRDRACASNRIDAVFLDGEVAGVAARAKQGESEQCGKTKLHRGRSLRGRSRLGAFIGTPFYGCKRRLTWPFRMLNPPLRVLIAAPRGFCAGVDRAIQIVELALERFGAPVYVRHEIVHNRFVVDRLRTLGAVFVDELDEVPDDRPVVFSAHGVPKSVPAEAQSRNLTYVDATCPLVSKVHRQAQRLIEEGKHILFIGHAGHPEVIGTFGQVPEGAMTSIETLDDVAGAQVPDGADLAFLTQTTLSVDDTAAMVDALKQRFPGIRAP